jgi:hypothetical protein
MTKSIEMTHSIKEMSSDDLFTLLEMLLMHLGMIEEMQKRGILQRFSESFEKMKEERK